jgi:hypothetical protein
MAKRLIIILALAMLVGLTAAAYAEVQNVKVSGDILAEGIVRHNLILRDSDNAWQKSGDYDGYNRNIDGLMSHVRVRVDADLTDNVSATVRLLNERMWGGEYDTDSAAHGNTTEIALDLAYATMKEFLYSPLTLTIGRQELHFGNDLIVGDVNTNGLTAGHTTGSGEYLPKALDDLSLRKSFDAIRATLNYDPLVVDMVYAKVGESKVDTKDDVDLFGGNAAYSVNKDFSVEAYYWEKLQQKAGRSLSSTGGLWTTYPTRANNDTTRTIGALMRYSGIKNLTTSLEGAMQFGTKVNNTTLYPDDLLNDGGERHRKAYAIQAIASYNLSDVSSQIKEYDPVIGGSYSWLSGDGWKKRSHTYAGWDPMYENQSGGTLFNKIVGFSNAQILNLNASAKPMEDVTLKIDYYYLRLLRPYRDAATDGNLQMVNLTGVAGDPTYCMKDGKKSLGNEVDASLIYDYTEDVQLGLTAGWFIPGDAFDETNDKTASQVIGSMKVTF